jgi:nucleoside-diphosphate-sugar epimerase
MQEQSVNFTRTPNKEDLRDTHWSYARGKLNVEHVIIKNRAHYTILRPTVVFGIGDTTGRGQWYVERLRKGIPIAVPSDPAPTFPLISAADVAKAFVASVEGPHYGVFHLAQDQHLTLRQFACDIAKELLVSPNFVPLTLENLKAAGPYYFPDDWRLDNSRARHELGWNPMPWSQLCKEAAML